MLVDRRITRRIRIPPCRMLLWHLLKIASSNIRIYTAVCSHYYIYVLYLSITSIWLNTVAYKTQWPIKYSNYLRILIYSMSQSALFNSAYNGDLTILTKPYAHGDNGTASWYSSRGGSSKGGSSKGGILKRSNRRLTHRRSITQKNFRRCHTTCKINHAHARRMRHIKCTRKCAHKH